MGKIDIIKNKLTALSGYKVIIGLFIVGIGLLIGGKMFSTKQTNTVEAVQEINMYTEQEEKISNALSKIDGVGTAEVIVNTKGNTTSVLVLAEGADDPAVNFKIRQAVRTIMQTDNKNIKIVKKTA